MKPLKLISLLAAFAVALVLTLLLIGCVHPNVETKSTSLVVDLGREIKVLKLDECEYLYGDWGNATVLTHKGDCPNPIHPEHTRQ